MFSLLVLFVVFLYLNSSMRTLRRELEDQRSSIESLRALVRRTLEKAETGLAREEVPAPKRQTTAAEVESKPPERPASAPVADAQTKQAATPEFKPVYVQKAIPVAESITASKGIESGTAPSGVDVNAGSAASARPASRAESESRYTSEEIPSLTESIFSFYQRYLGDKNPIVLTGIFLLFLGASFLLSYAVRHGYLTVSPSMRCLAVAIAAVGMFWFGWMKRMSHRTFGISLQGGAVAICYLDLFVAYRLLGLLPSGVTFFLLVALVAASGVLAILNEALTLALLGTIGGFLTPIVVSTGRGSHIELFSFYLVLDLGILALSYYRPWRVLNVIGFLFTFIFGLIWGARYYTPFLFSSVEPFLIAFFLLFWAVPFIVAHRHGVTPFGKYEAPVLFGTPLIGFALQGLLTAHLRFGMAWTAGALVLLYIGGAGFVSAFLKEEVRALKGPYLGMALVFSILTIPLAVNAHWTALAWAGYGVVLLWAGKQGNSSALALVGRFLQLGAAIAFVSVLGGLSQQHPIFNELFLGCAVVAAAAILSVILDRDTPGETGSFWRGLFLILGLVWWFLGGYREIDTWAGGHVRLAASILFGSISLLALDFLGAYFSVSILRRAAQVQPILLAVAALRFTDIQFRTFAHYSFGAWLGGAAIAYRLLFVEEKEKGFPVIKQQLLFLAVLLQLAVELSWRTSSFVSPLSDWRVCLVPFFLAAIVVTFTLPAEIRVWPFEGRLPAFRNTLLIPCCYLAWWLLDSAANGGRGSASFYLPLLNPLDAVSIFVLAVLSVWVLRMSKSLGSWERGNVFVLCGAAVFLLTNIIVARAVHHWFNVPYGVVSLYQSSVLQTTYSILWMGMSVALYALSSRRKERAYWFAGAALSAIVVLKLFMVELARVGTIGRVVSFICVGAIMVLIGYLFPLPPRSESKTNPQRK